MCSLRKIGILKPKTSREIVGSKIGVGFECLDRQMWDDTDDAYRLAGVLGVKHARLQTGWNRCETTPGVFDFAWLDRSVDLLLAEGIQPWFSLSYGNIHHTAAKEPDAVGWAPLYTEESRRAWQAYIAALVEHFRSRVTHFEVWNEPDIDSFWTNGPSAKEYVDLLRLTVPVIRAHHSDAVIIGGASGHGFSWLGFAVLEACLKEGMAQLIDVYSYHRYRVVPELYAQADFNHLRTAFAAYGGGHVKFWQGESGCPSQSSTTHALANTPLDRTVQAKVLCRSILTDLDMGVDYTCYFHFSDFKFYYRNGFCAVPNFFGLITFDQPQQCKPSYFAFQRLCSLFDNDTQLAPRTKIDMMLPDMEKSREKYAFQVDIVNTRKTGFTRRGWPLVSWYYPADLLPSYAGNPPYQPREVELCLWTPGQVIRDPVVIDPLTGDVFAADGEEVNTRERDDVVPQYVLHGVPLADYPLFVTDRAAVADLITAD